jgi:Uma2 family endonuclease
MVPVMNVAFRQPVMTRARFFEWAQAQDARYEFDGFQPVAMTGGNLRHNLMHFNLHRALHARLRGTGCRPLGADAGVATIGDAVRYPDGLVTRSPITGDEYVTPNVVVVFEVISPTSGRMDRIVKVREYAAVRSILRYVILESASVGLTVLERETGDQKWTLTTLVAEDTLLLPDLGIEIPVAELYEGIDFPASDTVATPPEAPAAASE